MYNDLDDAIHDADFALDLLDLGQEAEQRQAIEAIRSIAPRVHGEIVSAGGAALD